MRKPLHIWEWVIKVRIFFEEKEGIYFLGIKNKVWEEDCFLKAWKSTRKVTRIILDGLSKIVAWAFQREYPRRHGGTSTEEDKKRKERDQRKKIKLDGGEKEGLGQKRRRKEVGEKKNLSLPKKKKNSCSPVFWGFWRQLKVEQLECRLPGIFSEILLVLLTFYSSLFSGCFREFILAVWCGR